ncbi:phage portal protein [uncultured Bacteroides sp.]|uniref:phage portal protein n=1 Tax=uncultured Bacteroides sp. TaxID=162156 RepID=UPI002599FED4|nr:phage portal protein [uncultured Bacteroides sp.]
MNSDGTETELTNHPFLDFMAQPNPLYEMSSSAMWRLHEIYLMLVGESFMLIERDERGKPVELWVVPPHWVKMTPHLGSPTYTIVSPGGLTMTVPVDDMFVMKQLNPYDPFMRGLGIAESIADEVEIDEYAAKFQKRFFYNDATPPVVFLMPEASKEQRDEFMANWNKKHKGVENSHRAAALSGNVDVKELGSSDGKNLGFIESRVAMRDAVLEHFGMPREIMGITENSNRSTADAAQYIYAKNVLTPKIGAREEAVNKQLLPLFGNNLVWRYDPVIPYDKEFDKSKALDAYDKGLITKNEARRLMDLPDVDGGDVFKVSINDLFLKESDDPAELSQSLLQEETAVPEKKSRRVNVEAMLRREEQAVQENVRVFEAAVARHLAEQRSAIDAALGLKEKADNEPFSILSKYLRPDGTFDPELWDKLPEAEQKRLAEGIASGLIDWNAEAEKLARLLHPIWKKTYDKGAEIAGENYGLYHVERPEFVSPAKINGGKRIVGIEKTTRDKIADIIADGVSAGLSQSTLKKAIQAEMKDASKARVKTIARQETMTTLAMGQFDMMKAAGARAKTWHHREQKNPRDGTHGPNHIMLEGETVGIDERFSNGLRYPRDPEDGRAEEVINCRCYLTYSGF